MSRYTKKEKNVVSTIIAVVLSIILIGAVVVFAVPESRNAILDSFNNEQVQEEVVDKEETGDTDSEENVEDVTPEEDGEITDETLLAMFY